MRLGRADYYGDFVVYPVLVLGLAGTALLTSPFSDWHVLAAAFLLGAAAWTLIEYLLHRFILHHVPPVKQMHFAHHDDQTALIGTPTWLSVLMMFSIAFGPLWLLTDRVTAAGLTAGLMLGYLGYVSVHHVVHHWGAEPGTYLFALKRRHALHHHFDVDGNYGVTTGFWDKVFGTDINVREARGRKAAG